MNITVAARERIQSALLCSAFFAALGPLVAGAVIPIWFISIPAAYFIGFIPACIAGFLFGALYPYVARGRTSNLTPGIIGAGCGVLGSMMFAFVSVALGVDPGLSPTPLTSFWSAFEYGGFLGIFGAIAGLACGLFLPQGLRQRLGGTGSGLHQGD